MKKLSMILLLFINTNIFSLNNELDPFYQDILPKYFNIVESNIMTEKDAEKELCKVFEFLGVDKDQYEYINEVKNKTALPLFPKMNRYISKKFGYYSIINRVIVKINKTIIPSGYPKMDQSVRKKLLEYFRPHNKLLQNAIGRGFINLG